MNGLDRIIDEILADARAEADKIIAGAQQKAERIISAAKENAAAAGEKSKLDAELEYNRVTSRARSAAEVAAKRALLGKKQELISHIMQDARDRITGLDREQYFSYMQRLLYKYAEDQSGLIILNAADKNRITAGFEKAAAEKNLTVSEECRDIDGGFILVYGDIEENCSVSALMEEEKDRLHDAVSQLLFD